MSEQRQRDIQANGISLHITEQGSGPLVLLCHGWPELAYSWRESDRNLLSMSLATGVVTAVGPTHAANVYPGQVTQGFTVAPSCP